MYLVINGARHTCSSRVKTNNTLKFLTVTPAPELISGKAKLYRDDGFLLSEDSLDGWLVARYTGTLLYLSQVPDKVEDPTTKPEYRISALERQAEDTENIMSITFVSMAENETIDIITASEHMDLFAEWAYPVNYKTGQLRRFGEKLYRCVQDHTSQADWTPEAAPSLWAVAADPLEEWPEWSAPIGAHDAYDQGAQVSHNGKHWTSDVNGNVWEPGVYGWTEAVE